MKLLRFGPLGQERPGLLDDHGGIRDLSGVIDDVKGTHLDDQSLSKLAALNPDDLPLVTGDPRIGACVGQVGNFICIGLNYQDHADEAGMKAPTEPIIFLKATSSICGPDDDYQKPIGSTKLDWEVELAVVIGKTAKNVTKAQAMDHVAGYCTLNDCSERAWQLERLGQWTKGKGHDSFGPLGPWLVTKDDVPDPQNLRLSCAVNGKTYQDGVTSNLIFNVPEIISYVSDFITLNPGDVIGTGTPAGVGMGQKPDPIYLDDGDEIELEVEGLGKQRHTVRQVS